MKRRIRVGLLLDSIVQPAWVHRLVDGIVQSEFAELALVVKNEAPQPHGFRNQVRRLITKRHDLLRKLYCAIDDRLFASPASPFQRKSLEPLLDGCQTIAVAPRQTKYSDFFEDEDVERIRNRGLDVVFRFGFRILRGEALNIARNGVWSFHHADNRVNRGGPAGFWEVMEGAPVTGTTLQILTNELDAGRVLSRSWASTYKYSVRKNRDSFYWKSPAIALRKLQQLHRYGAEGLTESPTAEGYQPYSNRLYRPPRNLEMARSLTRLAGRSLALGWRNLWYRKQWVLGCVTSKANQISTSFHNCKLIVPPKDRFWADPFPIEDEGKRVIFVEELPFRTKKGHISAIELNPDGSAKSSTVALIKEHHLSHPFLFRWDGALYMIPESSANRTVELYRCQRFPDKWTLDRVLLSGLRAADPTLFQFDNRWWMFANVYEPGVSSNDELSLFYADSPLGPWRPHEMNPVKSDVRNSRPAGALFCWEGHWYRPAQDSSFDYGHSIVINRILELTPNSYVEKEVSRLAPKWHPRVKRTHTLNHCGGLTVVDGLTYRRRLL